MIKIKDILYLTSSEISDSKTIKLKNINNFCIFHIYFTGGKRGEVFLPVKTAKVRVRMTMMRMRATKVRKRISNLV